ncbi:pleiotropic regulatory protein RsmS [Xenorhabdus nematophila]|uniref:Pleiotropic regulatory protein RsmS n=1 Tax=Xenorhabdus nematophila (strain ATCC 19061 / DSM 3370 / CCUG 14189 / LMG 1036 / NCIMB 9965 / AN6) TaxID=406817 RepID=D3VL68_XENNA|nr:pleiotropic regulatory protein RsmS [Xenorhabdus nematophila]CEE92167.1 conserved hypothetical protein [Xenorhabdus nematophila str. Anatoliense]CEF30613.1 conserved hypothetical protein [Xenorhabdus nematophila str. Websteri]AYA40982.1 DUF2496 domain-containing protein [Xenorhabdus nematophila]MBA0019728.1 pleiotropic regulatory protein RsmS [Xenorhabdus nematophila]MCB4425122.1 pleiotropic regulatory protein RsmS [Xenorhabdus nematophila]
MTLEQAPPEVQLAVDLIYLLECNEVSPAIALTALEIIKHDLQGKLKKQTPQSEQ